MNRYEFETQLARLKAVIDKPWDQADNDRRKALEDELWTRFQAKDPARWLKIVTRVMDLHDDPKRLPLLKAFRDADKWLADNTPQESLSCEMTREESIRWAESEALLLTPHGAKVALAYARQARFKVPKDLRRLLVEIAGGVDDFVEIEDIVHLPNETDEDFVKRRDAQLKLVADLMTSERYQERMKLAKANMAATWTAGVRDDQAIPDHAMRAANDREAP